MATPRKKPEDRLKTGRPTSYKPEYCQMLIDHMAQGYSYECFGATIDVARSTVFKWADDFPEFSDAKRIAFDKCLVFWEKLGIEHVLTSKNAKSLNTGVWVFNMKNRFKWTDRQEITGQDGQALQGPQILLTLPDNGRNAKDEEK